MQVVCGNCQLTFQAPDGATGLVCPICRSPLRPPQAESAEAHKPLEWTRGSLDDLIAGISVPAYPVRVEVLPANGDAAVGEVHLIAGGVAEAIYQGKNSDDALDRLRAVKPARYRVEARLPNPADGDLTYPGPDSGKLEQRPLAHLMRYCEEFVITAAIEVWRGNENARVEYRRGEIGNITVGGIDAPERLAEVMKWSSGNYRLVTPTLDVDALVEKARAKAAQRAAAAAPRAAAPKPAPAAPQAAAKTIFGMQAPVLPVPEAPAVMPAPAPAAPPPAAAPPAPAPAPMAPPPGVAPPRAPAPAARASATKTIFGMPAPTAPIPGAPQPAVVPPAEAKRPTPRAVEAAPAAPKEDRAAAERAAAEQRAAEERAAAERAAAEQRAAEQRAAAERAAAEQRAAEERAAAEDRAAREERAARKSRGRAAASPDPNRSTHPGYMASSKGERVPRAAAAEETAPIRTHGKAKPIWTYVGVGFAFGIGLLTIYRLVGLFAN